MVILKVKDWLRLKKTITREDVLKARSEYIAKKWAESGLLEGLKGFKQSNIALLLESQASAMINGLDIQPVSDTFKATEQS